MSEMNMQSTAQDNEGVQPVEQASAPPIHTSSQSESSASKSEKSDAHAIQTLDVERSEAKGTREEANKAVEDSVQKTTVNVILVAVDPSALTGSKEGKKETTRVENMPANKENLVDQEKECKCCGGNSTALCHQKLNEPISNEASTSSLKRSLLH